MKTGGDNCTLRSDELDFETEELLVGSKVCNYIQQDHVPNTFPVIKSNLLWY